MLPPPPSRRALFASFATVLLTVPCFGNIALPALFADHMLLQRDKEILIEGTAAAGKTIRCKLAGESGQATVGADGHWRITLPPRAAGGPYELTISGDGGVVLHDVLIGDVWLASGQSNMNFHMAPYPPWTEGVLDYEKEIAAANDPGLRVFTVAIEASHKPQDEVHGVWQVCTPQAAGNFYGVAYYFAKGIREKTKVPVAIIQSARGSTSIASWMDRATLESLPGNAEKLTIDDQKLAALDDAIAKYEAALPDFRKKSNQAQLTDGQLPPFLEPYKDYGFRPSYLYNAMIHPLTRFPLKGFLWYQGEGDITWSKGYGAYFKAMITSWRAQWHEPDAPFLFVQICNHDPLQSDNPETRKLAGLRPPQRLAQAVALELPWTAMAVSADVGDPIRVHPRDKKTVGERLARAALALAYGEKIPFRGPRVKSIRYENGYVKIALETDGAALVNRDKTPEAGGFEIAGSDGVFHPAKAVLAGDTAKIATPSAPLVIRYAYADNPQLTIYDTNGLPLAPFVEKVAP